jgi:hypothetical protein
MGFFSNIAQNFKHGGVKLQLQAPGSVSMSDASVPITVTVIAGDTPQTINWVKVEVIAETPPANNTAPVRRVIATTQSTQVLQLAAGASQVVQLTLAMNIGAAAAEHYADNPILAAAANVVGGISQVAAALDNQQYNYQVVASADVANITFDPSVSQPIQVTKPGTAGTGTTLSV